MGNPIPTLEWLPPLPTLLLPQPQKLDCETALPIHKAHSCYAWPAAFCVWSPAVLCFCHSFSIYLAVLILCWMVYSSQWSEISPIQLKQKHIFLFNVTFVNSCHSGSQSCRCLESAGDKMGKENWCISNLQRSRFLFLLVHNEMLQKSICTFGQTDFWLDLWGHILDVHQGSRNIFNHFVLSKWKLGSLFFCEMCPSRLQPVWLTLNRALDHFSQPPPV